MDIKQQTQNVAAQGRYGDSMLLHVNPAEVKGLASAMPITTNPETGQPEAFLPFLAPILGSMLAPTILASTGLSAAAMSGIGAGLATYAQTGGSGSKALLSGLTAGMGTKALNTGAETAIGNAASDAAIQSATTAGGQTAASLATAGETASQAAIQAAQEGSKLGFNPAGNFKGFTPGEALSNTFSGGFDQGAQALATGMMSPSGMVAGAGLGAQGIIQSQEEYEQMLRQMGLDEEERKRKMYERYPEQIPMAEGGRTGYRRGGNFGNNNYSRFGFGDFENSYDNFSNMFDGGGPGGGGGYGGGGGGGYNYGGGYGPSRVRRTRPINPGFMAGFGPEQRYFQGDNPDTYLTQYATDIQGSNPYATPNSGMGGMFGGRERRGGMGGIFGGRRNYRPQLTPPPPPQYGGYGNPFMQTPSYRSFYGNPQMGGMINPYARFTQQPIQPYYGYQPPGDTPPPDAPPIEGPPDGPPIDGPPKPPIDGPPKPPVVPTPPGTGTPPPYEVPGMGNFKGNPVVTPPPADTPPGATPPATGTPPETGDPTTGTTPPTAGGPPPGTGRPPPDYYEDDDFFDRPGQGRPPMPPSIGKPGGPVPGGTPGFYDPPSGGRPPQYGRPPIQYPGGTPGFYEGPEPIDTQLPITRPPEITIPIEGGSDVTIPGFTMPGFGGKPIGGGVTNPILGGSDFLPKPPQISGPVNDGPGSGGMEDPNPIFKPPGRPGQEPISIGGPGGGITSIGQPLPNDPVDISNIGVGVGDPGQPILEIGNLIQRGGGFVPNPREGLMPIATDIPKLTDEMKASLRPGPAGTRPDLSNIVGGPATINPKDLIPSMGNLIQRGGGVMPNPREGDAGLQIGTPDAGLPVIRGGNEPINDYSGYLDFYDKEPDLVSAVNPKEQAEQGLFGTMGGPGSGNLGTASNLLGNIPNENVGGTLNNFGQLPELSQIEKDRRQKLAADMKAAQQKLMDENPLQRRNPSGVNPPPGYYFGGLYDMDNNPQYVQGTPPPGFPPMTPLGPQPIGQAPMPVQEPVEMTPVTRPNLNGELQTVNIGNFNLPIGPTKGGIKQPMPISPPSRPPAPILGGSDFLPQPPGDLRPVQPPQVGGGFMPQPAPPSVQPVPSIGFTPPAPTVGTGNNSIIGRPPSQATLTPPSPPLNQGISASRPQPFMPQQNQFGQFLAGGGETELPNEGLKALAQTEKGKEAVEAMGYQEGGQTDMMQDPITQEAIMFILGESENEDAINMFVERYGNEAFMQLRDMILKQAAGNPNVQTEGLIQGNGNSGMADDLPGVIGNKEQIAVSQDEFIVPADVVSMLGDGSSDAGSKQLYNMMDRVRQAKTGGTTQASPIDPSKVMPA